MGFPAYGIRFNKEVGIDYGIDTSSSRRGVGGEVLVEKTDPGNC